MNVRLDANVGSKEDIVLKIKNKQSGKVVAVLKDDATEPEILEKKKQEEVEEEAEDKKEQEE